MRTRSGLLNTSLQAGNALGLAALAAIASIVTRGHLPGHTTATALTDGYVAGLLAGAVIVAAARSSRCSRSTPDSTPTRRPATEPEPVLPSQADAFHRAPVIKGGMLLASGPSRTMKQQSCRG